MPGHKVALTAPLFLNFCQTLTKVFTVLEQRNHLSHCLHTALLFLSGMESNDDEIHWRSGWAREFGKRSRCDAFIDSQYKTQTKDLTISYWPWDFRGWKRVGGKFDRLLSRTEHVLGSQSIKYRSLPHPQEEERESRWAFPYEQPFLNETFFNVPTFQIFKQIFVKW